MKPLVVHPAAKAELAEAMDWYESRVTGLGCDLNDEVARAFSRARSVPERCAPHGKSGYRKVFVRRFPYIVYFLELKDTIWIAAVAHEKRRPNYWNDRRPEE